MKGPGFHTAPLTSDSAAAVIACGLAGQYEPPNSMQPIVFPFRLEPMLYNPNRVGRETRPIAGLACLEGCRMGSLSIWHRIVVIAVILLLFGRGKLSDLMGDVAQGIKAFRKSMQDDDKTAENPEPVKTIDHNTTPATATSAVGSKTI
jgi:sec-independent protein translocase protein TatA